MVGPLRYYDCTRVKIHNTVKLCKLLTKIITGKSGEGDFWRVTVVYHPKSQALGCRKLCT